MYDTLSLYIYIYIYIVSVSHDWSFLKKPVRFRQQSSVCKCARVVD